MDRVHVRRQQSNRIRICDNTVEVSIIYETSPTFMSEMYLVFFNSVVLSMFDCVRRNGKFGANIIISKKVYCCF